MDDITADIAGRVRAELARHNRSSRELADLLGLSTAGASRRMHGRVAFDAGEIVAIASWLDVSVDTLLPARAAS